MTWQRWGSPGHRSSASGNGVDAFTELTRLHLGSLRATACELAHVPSDAFVRELGASGYPGYPRGGFPPSSYLGDSAKSQGRTFTGKSHGIHGIRADPNENGTGHHLQLNLLISLTAISNF